MKPSNRTRIFSLALTLLVGGLACSTDSPTEPVQTPAPGAPGGGTPSGTWNISITSNRSQLEVDGLNALISIRVTDAESGALPPNGASISLGTSLGDFESEGSGIQSGILQLFTGNVQVALFPGSEEGTARLQAQLEGSVGQLNLPITAAGGDEPIPTALFVDRVDPSFGSPDGGETVRILGQAFEEPVRVFFGGAPAQVQSVNSGSIRVITPRNDTVPVSGVLSVDVEVQVNVNEAEQSSDTLVSGFTYTRGDLDLQPEIFSITPNSGPNEGGTRVTINGDGFLAPVQVLFESLEATVESVSRTQIVVLTPAATGFGQALRNSQVNVIVRNLDNGLTSDPGLFTYGVSLLVTAVDPNTGPYFGGTNVTIFGQGFDEPLVVDFGTVRQQVISVTGTEILVRTVGLLGSGSCSNSSLGSNVTNLETGESASGPPFIYQEIQLSPSISGVSPSPLTQAGGVVTISGRNFLEPIDVTFNDRPVEIISLSETSITATLPEIPNSDLDAEDCNDDGDSQDGERYITTPFDLVVANSDTGCSDTFLVNVTPDDTSCRDDEAPPEDEPTPTPEP